MSRTVPYGIAKRICALMEDCINPRHFPRGSADVRFTSESGH
jgi:hypothetical protein